MARLSAILIKHWFSLAIINTPERNVLGIWTVHVYIIFFLKKFEEKLFFIFTY